jgi:hypothetical protein
MSWRRIKITKEEVAVFQRNFKKKARLLLDENLDTTLAEGLRGFGWKVHTLEEVGLKGHDDEDVIAYAHHEDLVLITNDRDFRDERRFPPHRNLGIVIVPQELADAARSLGAVLPIVGEYRELARGAIVEVDHFGTIRIRSTKSDGHRTTSRYRYSPGSDALEWEEESAECA